MTIKVAELVQLRAFGRIDALWLTLFWTVSFAFVVASPQSSMGSLLAISTPAFMVWRTMSFRENVLNGSISFRRALYYSFVMFLHAICVFALVQFVYFKFIDGGRFVANLTSMISELSSAYAELGVDMKELSEMAVMLQQATPVELVMGIMMQNVLVALPVCLLVAVISKKRLNR